MTWHRDGITQAPGGGRPGGFREGLPPQPSPLRPEEDEDAPRRREVTFGDTGYFSVLLLAVVMPPVGLLFGVIGLVGCREDEDRRKAWTMTLAAVASLAFSVALNLR
jgi:hypothetical protein